MTVAELGLPSLPTDRLTWPLCSKQITSGLVIVGHCCLVSEREHEEPSQIFHLLQFRQA